MDPLWTKILIIVGFTLFVSIVIRFSLRRLKKLRSTPKGLKVLCEKSQGPVPWLILIYGLLIGAEIGTIHAEMEAMTVILGQIRSIFAVIALTWLTFRWKKAYEKYLVRKTEDEISTTEKKALVFAIGRVSSIFIVTIASLMILRILNIPIEALLAVGGIGTLTIGWAGKDVVANLFGGLMIYINRPFAIGDYVASPNKNFRGVVQQSGWYMTLIRNPDRLPTYVPNALITDAIVQNYTRMKNRRINTSVGIRYADFGKVETIVEDIDNMLHHHPDIDAEQSIMVHFIQYGAYSLDVEFRACTKTNQWKKFRTVQQDVLFKVGEIIEGHGAQIAFPTNTILLEQKSQED